MKHLYLHNILLTHFKHMTPQLTYNKRLIRKIRLDQYGDSLLNVSFDVQAIYQPFSIQKVSEKFESKSFEGNFSVN